MKKNATLTKYSKKGKLVIIIWMIVGLLFILKIGNPIISLSTLKDTYRNSVTNYSENTKYQKETQNAYNTYLEGLKNSDDVIIRAYFSLNFWMKALTFIIIELPYITFAIKLVEYVDDNYDFQKEPTRVRGLKD